MRNFWTSVVLSPDDAAGSSGSSPPADAGADAKADAAATDAPGDSTTLLTAGKKEEGKVEPAKVEAPAALTAADLAFPEGFEVSDNLRNEFLSIVNDGELSRKDLAARLIALQADTMKAALERDSALLEQQQEEWIAQTKALPKIGGRNLESTLSSARKLLDEYGSPEFEVLLDETGLGNHPEMVKFMYKVSQLLGEPGGPAKGAPSATGRSLEERMFPNQGKAA